jgi:hypothetical protein
MIDTIRVGYCGLVRKPRRELSKSTEPLEGVAPLGETALFLNQTGRMNGRYVKAVVAVPITANSMRFRQLLT